MSQQRGLSWAVAVLLFVACQQPTTTGTSRVNATTTTPLISTTEPAVPTTATVSSSTSLDHATTTSQPTTTTSNVNSLAEGSGCTPGTIDTLPDGEWFGMFSEVSTSSVDFDLACFFTGDAAAVAAAEDGEESPPPNDFHIRNVNPRIRTLDLASPVEVVLFGGEDTEETIPEIAVPVDEWVALFDDGRPWSEGESPPTEYLFLPAAGGTPYWLTIQNGLVLQIHQQYLP